MGVPVMVRAAMSRVRPGMTLDKSVMTVGFTPVCAQAIHEGAVSAGGYRQGERHNRGAHDVILGGDARVVGEGRDEVARSRGDRDAQEERVGVGRPPLLASVSLTE